jgi:O-antigen/teichoic acid export membrane protein
VSTAPLLAPVTPAVDAGQHSTLSESARVGRNTAFRAGAQALSALVNVAGMVLLGNGLSAAGYGDYAYWYALIPLFASVCDLGAGVIVTREMVRDRAGAARVLSDGLLLRALVGGVLLMGGAAAGFALPPMEQLLLVLVVTAAVLDFSQDAAVWAFRARERLDLESVLLLVSQFAWLAGVTIALRFGGSMSALLLAAVAAFALRALVGGFLLMRMSLWPRFAFEPGRLRALVAEGWPVGLSLLLVVLYGRAGVFVLKALASSVDVACFNVAYLLSQPFGFLASALSMAAFPAFARRAARSGPGADARALAGPMRAALKYQLVVAVPIAAGLALLADALVPLLFHDGDGYAGAVVALRVMALAVPFVFMNLHARYLLAAIGRQRAYLVAVCVGLVANVLGCALTAKAYGALGAAWTFVAAEALVFAVVQVSLRKELPLGALVAEAWRPLVAALVVALAVAEVRDAGLVVEVVAGAVAYAAALVITRALTREEWSVLRSVLATFRPTRRAARTGQGRTEAGLPSGPGWRV